MGNATLIALLLIPCFSNIVSSYNVTVSKDGVGDFTRIMDAVLAAPNTSTERYIIHLRKGIYEEYVVIPNTKTKMRLIGEGMDSTIITGNRSAKGNPPYETYYSATVMVYSTGFIAESLTIENNAGPTLEQAVALKTEADMTVYYKVRIVGYQDTLYIHSNRHFFRECQIGGTVDFVFGKGAAVFQNCTLVVKDGLPEQYNTITAQSRDTLKGKTGFSFQFCTIIPDESLLSNPSKATYLGRPWNKYATTVFMQSYMSSIIKPEGWSDWGGREMSSMIFYGEYLNFGPGADTNRRIEWPGYHIMRKDEAEKFTVKSLIHGDQWLPGTGVDYTSELEKKEKNNTYWSSSAQSNTINLSILTILVCSTLITSYFL